MAKINFRVLLRPLCECQGYTEMSATELRVLISLIENGSWAPAVIKVASEIFSSMKNMRILEEKISIKSALHDISPIEKMADEIALDIKK